MRETAEGISESINFEGVPMSNSFSRSVTTGWTVVIGVPKAIMMADIRRGLWWALACTALLSLAGILMALMMARRISGSIHGLIAPALALGRGEPVIIEHLELAETNEVGESLARASQLIQQQAEERARAEAARRESQELKRLNAELEQREADASAQAAELAAIMDAVPAVMFIAHDPECKRITSNRAGYELLRLPPGSNTSKSAPESERNSNFHLTRDGRETPPHELPVQMAATGREIRDAEYTIAFDDGSSRSIFGDAVPLLDGEGEVVGAVGAFIDITERERAEKQLQVTAKRLRGINTIFKQAFDCETDEELGRICLKAAQEITGSECGFVIGIDAKGAIFDITISDPGWELCKMRDQTGHRTCSNNLKLDSLYGRVLQSGKSLLTNAPAEHPDSTGTPEGHPPLTSFLGVPLVDGERTIGMIAVANREGGYSQEELESLEALAPAVVETLQRIRAERAQKQAQAQLKATAERLQAILDNAPIAITTFDEHGRLLEANRTLYRILGYSESELIGEKFADYTHPDDLEKNLELHRQLSTGERQAYELEKRYIRKDGSVLWAYVRVAVLDNKTRVSIAEDITERKQAQEQLLRTAERLQAILDNAPVGIVITDREGRLIEYNAAHLRMCGRSPEELIGTSFMTYTHPDDIGKNLELFGLVTSGKQPSVEIEKRYLRKDGTIVWVHVTSSSIDKDFNIGIVEDITARKQAEQQLRATADRLKAIMEHAPVGIVTGSREFRFLETNAAFQQMTGYSADELRQIDWKALTHPDDIAANVELVGKLFAGELEAYDYEKRYLPKNGKTIWVRIVSALVDSEVKMSIVEDITKRKHAEDALRKSEAGLAAAQRIAHIGSWHWDIQKDDAYWSDETFRIFDFTPDRLKGHRKAFLGRIHPADRQRVDDALSDALSGTGGYDVEYRICLPDGSEKVIHAQAEVLRNEDGKPVVMQGTVHDITERKRAQQALAASQERLQAIVQNAPVGVNLLDRKGRVQEANPALCHILGYSAEELKGKNFKEYTHPEDLRQSRFDKWEPQPYELEKRYIRKDGNVVWVRVVACPINHNFMIGIVEDITARKKEEEQRRGLEEQLRQAQKMEAVGHLAGGVAHDFNNLLMVIQSYAEMLQDSLPAHDRLRRNTQEIMKAAARAAGLTRQLLAFSRKQILSPVVLDLNAVVDEAARMLKRLIGEDIEFRLSPAESLWAIKADPDQIVQVLMNLCVNARDAMPQGGTLTMATGNVTVDAGAERPYVVPGDYVMLSVADTGIGIRKEMLGRIFDPFFTTKEVGKGTGLGLATVYGIVKQSGGYVWVDSELGQGACFTVYLPRAKGAIASDVPAKAKAQPRGTGTILVAEDEEALREAVCDYLRSLGYTVLEATSGQDALAVVSKHEEHLDLLITDLVMPRMSGEELSRMLGPLRPDLKTIYMSGYTDDAALRHGVLEANVTFLQKPFNLGALARKVREMLGPTETVQ